MRRLGYIDGLRALAVLGVIVYHASPPFKMGAHGVDLFFVISGFCLAYPYLERFRRTGSYAFDGVRYFARRLLRILPPYYAAIAILAALAPVGYVAWHADATTPWGIVQQLLFLDRDKTFLERSFWTMPIEFRWYFAFPLLLWIFTKSPRGFAAIGIASVCCYYFTRQNCVDVGTISAFMLGIWAAHLQITESPLRKFALAAFAPAFVLATLLEPGDGGAFYAVEPIGMIAAFSLVVLGGAGGPVTRVLQSRVLAFFGVASYSIYLFSDPVIRWTESAAHLPAWVAVALGTIVPLAFWWAVERPLTTSPLSERLTEKIELAIRAVLAIVKTERPLARRATP